MFIKIFISFIFISLLMIGCSKKENNVKTDPPVINKDHLLSTQKQTLDKAKQVEQMLIDGKNSRQKAMEQQLK